MGTNYKTHKGKPVTIEDIVLETDDTQGKVKRVKLKTAEIGYITWRAKIPQTEYAEKNGFKIETKGSKVQPTIEELPEIVYDIQRQLKDGPVPVIANYSEWTLSAVPRYSMTDKQFYAMQIPEAKTKKKK